MLTRSVAKPFVEDCLPLLDPIIGREKTDYGWRGLTEHGEVFEVTGGEAIPDSVVISRDGHPVGRREVMAVDLDIAGYLESFNRGREWYHANACDVALHALDRAIDIAPTARARYNRALTLLSLGRWREGFEQYELIERAAPFARPQACAALEAGLRPWRGENLAGKRLAIIHAHGFGDSIMMLRYVAMLRARGADVVLTMPRELTRLAAECAPVSTEFQDADFFCCDLHLLHWLQVTPRNVAAAPFLSVEPCLATLPSSRRRRIGIAWSTGMMVKDDFPRRIPLGLLTAALDGAELHSIQKQGAPEAELYGVRVHEFADFADCAALMWLMDEIVSVDTAALHLAGAIGHPRVTGLLSYSASWRWLARWYANVRLYRQPAYGDWNGALAAIQGNAP